MRPIGPQDQNNSLLVRARDALLDALDALSDHRESVVVVGAQAVYLHTGAAATPVAEATKDSDLAIDGRKLADQPLIDAAMRSADFQLDKSKNQPGTWVSADGIPGRPDGAGDVGRRVKLAHGRAPTPRQANV
jgi:hypothetical protein